MQIPAAKRTEFTNVASRRTVADIASDGGNQSVARALFILDLLARSGELGVRDIARRMQIAPSIAHRLVTTLASQGYLEQAPASSRYRIGHQAYRVGSVFLEYGDVGTHAAPELARLAEQHGINGFLGVQRGHEVVYLQSVQSGSPLVIKHPPGATTHLHSTALGKTLLAVNDDATIEQLLGPPPFRRLTERTITDLPTLLADIGRIRAGGPALSAGENYAWIYAAGAPLRDATGRVVAAISGAIPLPGSGATERDDLVALVRAAARRISRRLGARDEAEAGA